MATTLTLTLRCQSKNLMHSPDGTPLMNVSLQTVQEPGAMPPMSSVNAAMPMVDDTFVLGKLYTVAITDSPA